MAPPSRSGENEIATRIVAVLRQYVSELTANSLLESALERTGLVAARLQQKDVSRLLPSLERGGRLFMRSQADAEEAIKALSKLAAVSDEPSGAWRLEEPMARRTAAGEPWRRSSVETPARRPAPGERRSLLPDSTTSDAPRRSQPDPGSRRPEARLDAATPGAADLRRGAPQEERRGELLGVMGPPLVVSIRREEDIVRARSDARHLVERQGASVSLQTQVATVVSELARNIFLYAGGNGVIELCPLAPPRRGVDVLARDQGPGIADVSLVLDGNYRSKLGMGLGLRGVRRLSSYFALSSVVGAGTTVRAQLRIE